MQACLEEQIGRNIEVYIDDIIVKTQDNSTLIDDLRQTFDNLNSVGIHLVTRDWPVGAFWYKALQISVR